MSRNPTDAESKDPRAVSRRNVLRVLREVPGDCRVPQIARRTGLHSNTVRFHLERLEEDGLVSRKVAHSGAPGRPPLAYVANPVPDAGSGHRDFRQLADVLAQLVSRSSTDRATTRDMSIEAGRSWGVARTPETATAIGPADALRRIEETLREIGFAPETDAAGERITILQRHCPFLEVAQDHQDVVCSVHLGLIHGILDQTKAPVTIERLVPFASPSGCELHIARHG